MMLKDSSIFKQPLVKNTIGEYSNRFEQGSSQYRSSLTLRDKFDSKKYES